MALDAVIRSWSLRDVGGEHYAQRSAASVGTRHRSHRLSMLAVSPSLIGVRPKLIMIQVHSCVHDVGGSAGLWVLGMGFNGQRHAGILPESYGIGSQWLALASVPIGRVESYAHRDSSARCIAVGMMSEARQHYKRWAWASMARGILAACPSLMGIGTCSPR